MTAARGISLLLALLTLLAIWFSTTTNAVWLRATAVCLRRRITAVTSLTAHAAGPAASTTTGQWQQLLMPTTLRAGNRLARWRRCCCSDRLLADRAPRQSV